MVVKYVSVVLKFFSLGLVIAAGGFWSGAEVDSRPKYRDEQTLVGGAIWTQTIIPIGLIISIVIDEALSLFVHGYFLMAGVSLLVTTGLVLVIGEYKTMRGHREFLASLPSGAVGPPPYDKVYFVIGVLCLIAGVTTLADFVVILVL